MSSHHEPYGAKRKPASVEGLAVPLLQDNGTRQIAGWWDEAERAVDAGHVPRARRFLRWILAIRPDDEEAWLWLARLASEPRQQLAYLRQAYAFHPHSRRTAIALREARGRQLASAARDLVAHHAVMNCLPDQRRRDGEVRPKDGHGHLSSPVAKAMRRRR
jgi:hypothetical protein